jgi:ADP-heptose:LPS heptosyltransferase
VSRTWHTKLPARLLADLPNWLGDVVMTLPAISRLVEANAGSSTVLHSRPPVKRLLAQLFPETTVVASQHRASPFLSAFRLCRDAGRFDIGVTLRHASRAKILIRLAARATYGSAGSDLLLTRKFSVDRQRHQVYDCDPILDGLGLDGVDPSWRPVLPEHLRTEGEAALRQAGAWSRPLAGLAPAAAWGSSKQWPAARYGELAARLLDKGLQPVILIGPGEEPTAELVTASAGIDLPVVGAEVDVAGLAGILSHLAVLICNDSGPMHLAATVETPVVALFGPTDPARTAPLGDSNQVLSLALDCAPCFEVECPLRHQRCLQDLSLEKVVQATLKQVAGPS